MITLTVILILALTVTLSQAAYTPSKFCRKQNGTVWKLSLWNSVQPPSGVRINSVVDVCSIPNELNTNVYIVPLTTLFSNEPTLAVLAFNSRQKYAPPKGTSPSANPAAIYCSQLGGITSSSLGFTNAHKYLPRPNEPLGWWSPQKGTYIGAYDLCMFPDGSSIEEWTLGYHAFTNSSANNIVFAYNVAKSL
jgi:putative hemolysin